MNYKHTYDLMGNVDIYVIDQILKGRYQSGESILDAGCAEGRNLKWFYQNDFMASGIDFDSNKIAVAKNTYPNAAERFIVGKVDDMPYGDNSFDHVLCCAVLHFARSKEHFAAMLSELVRVVKPSGSLLVRVASDIGLEGKKPFVQDGTSHEMGNFYITRQLISEVLNNYPLYLIEPVKTTNVQDVRAMTTLVFQKG